MAGEGFLEEVGFGEGGGTGGDEVAGIARHEEEREIGAKESGFGGEFGAGFAGHDDVGEEKIDGRGGVENVESGLGVLGFYDEIASSLEKSAGEFAQRFVGFDQENCGGALCGGRIIDTGFDAAAGLDNFGEINGEGGSLPWFAVNLDVAAALLDDAVDGGEAETGAAAAFLGGEKSSKIRERVVSSMPLPVSATVRAMYEPGWQS